jgi:hypothetical protein
MSLFENRLKYVTCKTWDATRPDFVFPEQGDPELRVAELMARPNLGLALMLAHLSCWNVIENADVFLSMST